MKFSSGCLVGVLLGIILSVAGLAAWTFLNSRENLALFPASSAGDPDVTVTLKEQYIDDQLQAGMAVSGVKLSDIMLNLHSANRAEATMAMPLTVLGKSIIVRPHASFHFGLSNGSIAFDIDKVDVSGIAVPQDILNQQIGVFKQYGQDQLNAELSRMLAYTGLHIIGIESTEGALILKLSR